MKLPSTQGFDPIRRHTLFTTRVTCAPTTGNTGLQEVEMTQQETTVDPTAAQATQEAVATLGATNQAGGRAVGRERGVVGRGDTTSVTGAAGIGTTHRETPMEPAAQAPRSTTAEEARPQDHWRQ